MPEYLNGLLQYISIFPVILFDPGPGILFPIFVPIKYLSGSSLKIILTCSSFKRRFNLLNESRNSRQVDAIN